MERLPPHTVQFVVDELLESLDKMCVHVFGCRVAQRVLEYCLPAQTEPILNHVQRSLYQLAREQYGNYVVQHVLEHGRSSDRQEIMALLCQRPLDIACHKYGSNVMEKALLLADAPERYALVEAMLGRPRSSQGLKRMVDDRFANYVVQRLLDLSAPEQKREVVRMLRADCMAQLQKSSQGKHVVQKLEQLEVQFANGVM